MKTRLIASLATAVTLSACGSQSTTAQTVTETATTTATTTVTVTAEPSASATTTAESSVASTPAASTAADGGAGTRDSPVPVGTPARVGDWTVTLEATNTDAAAVVKAENQFNEDPAAGRQFVMAKASLVYSGATPQTPAFDLRFVLVGGAGNSFGSGGLEDYCGSIPSPLTDVGEMFTDAQATGNVCVSAPAEQISGATWSVEAGFGNDPVFLALQ